MNNKRKSFIIHIDSLEILDKLTDEQAGKLFRAIKAHHAGEELELDLTTDLIFTPFKSQFERDDEKYNKIVERNKNNGLKGGRPKTQEIPEEAKKPTGLSGNPTEPKKADSVSKNDSGSGSGSGNKDNNTITPDGDITPPPEKPRKPKVPSIDYLAIQEIWNTHMTKASKVTAITDKRKRAIKKLFDVFQLDLAKFENYVNYVNSNPKCQWMFEEQDRGNGQVWQKKGFDYITSEACFLRVKEEY